MNEQATITWLQAQVYAERRRCADAQQALAVVIDALWDAGLKARVEELIADQGRNHDED